MGLAVVLSTFNAPRLLEKVLHGYAAQRLDGARFELVVADDGSGAATRGLLERLGPQLGLDLRHVWHEDEGFRKTIILNRALVATQAEYVVFSDGDCIPREDFLATHLALSEPGRFLSGGYFKLPRGVSEALTVDDVAAGRGTDPAFLCARGLRRPLKRWRLGVGPRLGSVLDALTPTKATWNGHNASGWRRDLLAANGFDERMRYGGEDRELGERLENAGIRGKQVRHRAVCVHLWHERGYDRPEDLARNLEIRAETRKSGRTVTEAGIEKR